MPKKIAILQSNYIPWRGYFDIIKSVDAFVFLDNVQYTKNDWRNRNQILTKNGLLWLTIPILTSKMSSQLICEAQIKPNTHWNRKHYTSIVHSYGKTPYFEKYREALEDVYLGKQWTYLSDLNICLIKCISSLIGIKTEFVDSRSLNLNLTAEGDSIKSQRVVEICKQLGANQYLSGPAAASYMEMNLFQEAEIEVSFIDYGNYPAYQQIKAGFEPAVSILDLLFMQGDNSLDFIGSSQKD